MKRLLKYIFIPIFAVLFMSHNVGAIPVNISLDDINISFQSMVPPFTCSINGSSGSLYLGWCYTDATGDIILNDIKTDESISVHENDYIEFDLIIRSENNLPYSDGYYLEDANAYDRSGFRLLSRDLVTDVSFYSNYLNITSGTGGTLSDGNYFYHIYHYVYKYVRTDTRSVQLGLLQINAQRGIINARNGGSDPLSFRLGHILVYQAVTHDVNKEQKEAADQAISDSESSSQENSSNAKTTNLIGALSGIFTTISSTSATNCNITGDLGAINMGSLNLCQGKEHFNSLIEFIGFSALFVVVFWASYHLVKRTLGLIDWARSN